MGELSYKQLHQFSCGKLTIPERNSLVSSCSHGCFVCVSDQCLFLYDTESYLEATRLCELRRDKPLSDHKPNITVSSVDPIIWTAFNSDGLTLSVITSSESRGTFVNLVNVIDLVKRGSTDLQNISRSVRVCGGENDLWKLRDFAWSPTDPTTFVVVLDSGVVRLFSFLTDGNGSVTLVGQLPMTANCRCVSWSPKGKQLAICLTGSLSTPNGLAQGPLILQVDPQLQQKRIVPLGHLFESNHEWNNSLPFDLLWTSSYTFLLAIKQSTNEPQLTCSTHVLYISTTSKSPEPSAVAVDGLSSQMNCDHLQYYFRFLGPNHVVVTWAYVGEEVLVLQLPPNASGNSPQVVMSVELPPDGCAVSMDVGVFRKDNESAENSLVYMIAYLSNGNVCPYLLNSNDLLTLLNPNPPKLVSLLIPKPSVPSADKTIISNSPKPTFVPSSSYSNGMPVVNQAKPSIVSSVDSNHTTQFLPINGITVCSSNHLTPTPMNSFTISTESNTTSLQNNTTVNRSFSNLDNMPTKTISENKEYCVDKSKLTDSRDIPLPKSVQVAAAHFTSALQSEAKSGRLAWRNLFNILISGDIEGKSDKSIGLDIIEARLFDVDRFLKAMDEVLIELTNAVTERKEDLTNSVNFGERLRRALRLYATSDWFHTLSGHLDPETNRLFSQVKRRARLAEAGLYDLENQIESLSSEINTVSSKNVTTILPSPSGQGKEKFSTRNVVTNDPNIMRTMDTNANLIRAERSRIDFIMEKLKRLGLSPMKNDSTKSCDKKKHQKSIRPSLNSSNISVLKDGGYDDVDNDDYANEFNPYRTMLIERDQALLRLFSNYKLPVIHPSNLCPSISSEGDSIKDAQPSPADMHSRLNDSQSKTILSPGNLNNSRLEQLLVVSGEIASNTIVSVTPKTSPKPIEKNVDDIKRSGDSPLVSSNLSFKTSASVISKPDMGSDIKESQIVDCSTASSVHPMPILNDNDRYKANATHQQSLPFGTKSTHQILFNQPNSPAAPTVSSTVNNNSLFGTSSFKPQLSTAPSIVTTSVLTSTPFVINNAGVISVPTSQKIEPSLTNSTTSVTMNRTHLVNSNQVMSTNSLINAPVIPKPIDSVNGSERETNEIKKENLIPDISSVNSPQTTIVTSKSSGLFSFLPTPVCSSSTMFGSKQDQNATSTTAAFSSASNSLFTGIPLATCTTTADSNSTTKSTAAFNYKPLFGPPISISATTTSPTSIAGDNLFLFGTLSQSPIVSKSPTTTFIPTSPIVCQTGTPLSKSEGLTTLFGSTTSTTPVALPFSGTTFAASLSTLRGGSASTTSISTPSLFDTPVFSKSTTMSSGGLFGTNVSSFQTTTSTQVPVAGLFSFLNTATTSSSFTNTTTVVTTGSTTTTSVTPSFSGLFSSSIFGNSSSSGQTLFQTTTMANNTTTAAATVTTVSPPVGLFGSLTNTSASGDKKLFSSQLTTQPGGFLFGSPSNPPVSGSKLFQTNATNLVTTTSAPPLSTTFGGLLNASSVTSTNNNTTVSAMAAQTTNANNLFNFSSGASSSLFGSSTINHGNSTPGTGLFGTVSNAQQVTSNPTAATPAASSNLFGSPLRSDTKCLDSLFSSSSLNLGGNSTNQNSTQNVFGKPFGNTAFGNQTNSTLFGSPTSVPKTNAAISASSPPSGLFGNSILGSSLFTSPTTATAVSSSGGGLFSNIETNVNSGTGLFGAQSSGGFGSSPIFGSPAFNKPVNNPSPIGQGLFGMSGPAAFNSSGGGLFGSVGSNPVAVGGSLFGSGSNPPAGGGLFASLGNKTDNLSFGSLAQNSPPGIGNIPVSPFGMLCVF
ncbi:Alpha N-terminal protein methyltransferase 1 [Schistosoma japonicum]|nr:Alpha N-terminal protein methyltransferase 1 [Schistosoma japonicum]